MALLHHSPFYSFELFHFQNISKLIHSRNWDFGLCTRLSNCYRSVVPFGRHCLHCMLDIVPSPYPRAQSEISTLPSSSSLESIRRSTQRLGRCVGLVDSGDDTINAPHLLSINFLYQAKCKSLFDTKSLFANLSVTLNAELELWVMLPSSTFPKSLFQHLCQTNC